jgi:hypothetical protein
LGKLPKELWWALLELFALTGLAIAQPLLDVTGKAPDFFLYHRAGRTQILAVVALIVLAPAVGLWLGEVIAAQVGGEWLQRLAHLAALAGLVTALAIESGKKVLPIRGTGLVVAAVLVGLAAAWAYANGPVLRLWLRYLSPAPLVFVLLFVTVSPSSSLMLPARPDTRTAVPVRADSSKALPPVVVIVFDEFPLMSLLDSQGEVDPRVYPNFAEFAARSTWYRNATGIGGWTPHAVPAMLSGRYPGGDRKSAAPNLSSYPHNLFTLFGHYYDLKVFETVTQLCPADKCGQTGSPTAFTDLAEETAKVYKSIVWPIDPATDPAATAVDEDGPTAYFDNLKYDQPHRVDTFVRSISSSDRQSTLYFLHPGSRQSAGVSVSWLVMPRSGRTGVVSRCCGAARRRGCGRRVREGCRRRGCAGWPWLVGVAGADLESLLGEGWVADVLQRLDAQCLGHSRRGGRVGLAVVRLVTASTVTVRQRRLCNGRTRRVIRMAWVASGIPGRHGGDWNSRPVATTGWCSCDRSWWSRPPPTACRPAPLCGRRGRALRWRAPRPDQDATVRALRDVSASVGRDASGRPPGWQRPARAGQPR